LRLGESEEDILKWGRRRPGEEKRKELGSEIKPKREEEIRRENLGFQECLKERTGAKRKGGLQKDHKSQNDQKTPEGRSKPVGCSSRKGGGSKSFSYDCER